MQISTIILQSGSEYVPSVRLQPGQLVPVEVPARKGSPAVVRVAGRVFPAGGELPPSPATFWARVESIKPGFLYLRRLDSPPEIKAQLASITGLLDLPHDPDTVKLLEEMLKRQLPLNRAVALRLLAEGKKLPPEERDAFWPARVWLEILTLEADTSAMRLAMDYLLGRSSASPQGQEVLNQALPLSPGQEMVCFFTFKNKELSGELFIVGERTGKKTGRDFPRGLVVRLQSPFMKETWVYLAQNTSGLTARVIVAEERFVQPVKEAGNVLRARLSALGYRLEDISVSARLVSSVCELLYPSGPVTYRPLNKTV